MCRDLLRNKSFVSQSHTSIQSCTSEAALPYVVLLFCLVENIQKINCSEIHLK